MVSFSYMGPPPGSNSKDTRGRLSSISFFLSLDLVDKAILFLSNHESVDPEKPWLLWLAFGACHAPHHARKECIEKYKGKFDKGWDKVREETLERQKKMGIIPKNTELARWDKRSSYITLAKRNM
ncbi:MAG: sulfatase-like hydrolase/transferase [Candidatus Nitrosopolaris sp.]